MAMTLDDYRDQVKSDIKDYLTQEDLWPTAEPGTSEYDEQTVFSGVYCRLGIRQQELR